MLKNKVVQIENPELLQFFYPEYQIRDELTFRDKMNKVIYTGKMRNKIKDFLSENTKSFISTVGKIDINLDNQDEMLDFVYSKYGKRVTKKVKRSVDIMDDEDFIFCIKTFWVTGEWVFYLEDDELSIYDLFKSTLSSTVDMFDIYFSLLDNYPFYVLESSFFTFLQRTGSYEEQSLSDGYKRLLNNFNTKSGHNLKPSIMKYMRRGEMNEQLRFLELMMDLR